MVCSSSGASATRRSMSSKVRCTSRWSISTRSTCSPRATVPLTPMIVEVAPGRGARGRCRTTNCSAAGGEHRRAHQRTGATTSATISRSATNSSRRGAGAQLRRALCAGSELGREVDVQARAGTGLVQRLGDVDAERQHRQAYAQADARRSSAAACRSDRRRCRSRRRWRCRGCCGRSRITSTVPVITSLPPTLM